MAEVQNEVFDNGIPILPSNSIGSPTEDDDKPTPEPVVQASAELIEEKDTFTRKLRRALFNGDDTQSVGDYIIFDVAVPALKDLVSEMASSAVDMILFGEVRGGRSKSSNVGDTPSYSAYYKHPRKGAGQTYTSPIGRSAATPWGAGHGANDRVSFLSRRDAEDVLDALYGVMEEYGVVTVADFLSLSGLRPNYTDNSYGWTSESDIRRMSIRRIAGGRWTIDTPYALDLGRR